MTKLSNRVHVAAVLCERSLLESGYVWVGRLDEGERTSFMLRHPKNGNRATILFGTNFLEIKVNGECVERSTFK